jgi:hypothetical protein
MARSLVSFALLSIALVCLPRGSYSSPVHQFHKRALLHNGAHVSHKHIIRRSSDADYGDHRGAVMDALLHQDETENDTISTEQDSGKWVHERSNLGTTELDLLLQELGMSYSDVRELVKRAGQEPGACTTSSPAVTVQTSAPTSPPPSAATQSPSNPGNNGRNMNVVYYAQSPATPQTPLPVICADPTINVVILSFITDFFTAGGYPTVSKTAFSQLPG